MELDQLADVAVADELDSGEAASVVDAPGSEVGQWIQLRERVQERNDRAGAAGPSAQRPAARAIADALAAWRAADRNLAGLSEADPDWNRVHAEVVGLRALHHRLFDERLAAAPTSWGLAAAPWLTPHAPTPRAPER